MLEKQGVAHSKPLRAAWVNLLLNCNLSKELIQKLSFSLVFMCFFFHALTCMLVKCTPARRVDYAGFCCLFVSYYPLDNLLSSLSFVVTIIYFAFLISELLSKPNKQRLISGRYFFRALEVRPCYPQVYDVELH